MKIKQIVSVLIALSSLTAINGSAVAAIIPAPITFTLSVSSNPTTGVPVFSGSNFGSVKLTQVGATEVDFTVTLAAGYAFANTGSNPTNAFAFNLGSGFAIALTNPLLTPGTPANGNKPAVPPSPVYAIGAGPDSTQTGGFGSFSNGIQFTNEAEGGLSGSYTAPITFKVTKASGVSYSDFENKNAAGYLFTADVGFLSTGATGNVGSGKDRVTPDGDPSSVPEPKTIALFGLGLLGFAITRRSKS